MSDVSRLSLAWEAWWLLCSLARRSRTQRAMERSGAACCVRGASVCGWHCAGELSEVVECCCCLCWRFHSMTALLFPSIRPDIVVVAAGAAGAAGAAATRPTPPHLPKSLSVMIHQSIHQENQLSEALASVANIGVSNIHQVSRCT